MRKKRISSFLPFLLAFVLGMMGLVGLVKATAAPAQASSASTDNWLQINKPMVRQSDGTLVEDETVSGINLWANYNGMPKKITNAGTVVGRWGELLNCKNNTAYAAWDEDQYTFIGWQIGNTFYDGTQPQENSVKVTATEENGLKSYLPWDGWYIELYTTEYTSTPCKGQEWYRMDFGGEKGTGINGILEITPVFEKEPEMAYTINLEQTEGGTISQFRKGPETHQLTATPNDFYTFVRWEKSTDGENWTAIDGDAKTLVTLSENTTYRAVFNSTFEIATEEVQNYALPAEGDSWYLNLHLGLNQEQTAEKALFTVKVYEGEEENEDKLLGETNNACVLNYRLENPCKINLTKRPSDPQGKILVTAMLNANGASAKTTYQLSGTLDIESDVTTVNTLDTAFLGKAPAEVQLTVKGNPEVKSGTWSGGKENASQGTSTVNEKTGLVTYTAFSSTSRKDTFTVEAGDGRIATKDITFTGGQCAKIDAKKAVVKAGESKEYTGITCPSSLRGSMVKVTSSDENIFTASVITKGSGWSVTVDKIKINGIKAGTATLTLTANNRNPVEVPVVVQSDEEAITDVTLSKTQVDLEVGDSETLEAVCTPETAAVTFKWSSSDDKIVSVEDGKITALKRGSAVITVDASDAQNHTFSASCTVNVKNPVYTAELYVPKNTVAADGFHVYPSTGTDKNGRDTFDTANAVENIIVDTDSNKQYDIYTMSLEEGTYSYRAVSTDGKSLGGGAFAFPSGDTANVDKRVARINLRVAELSVTNEFDGKKASTDDFTAALRNSENNITMGDAYVNADGNPTYRALICANADTLLYHAEIIPTADFVKAHDVSDYRKQKIAVERDASVFTIAAELKTGCFTINAPAGADVALYERVTSLKKLDINKITPDTQVAQDDGTVDYRFHVDVTNSMTFKVDGADYVTYAGTVKPGSQERLVITESMLKPSGKTKSTIDRNVKSNGGANLGDMYLNVNAQGYLSMNTGNTFALYAKRNWWGCNVTWVLDKDMYLVEPDYHYTIVDLDGNASDVVTVDENGQLTANKKGTAIVLVTYDSMTVNYPDDLCYSYEGYKPNGFYGATWPENTGVFVVSVDEASANISTGMTINADINKGKSKTAGTAIDAELDPIYFLGNEGSYTFTPESGVSVAVANPSVKSGALTFNGFRTVAAGDDGSYTVPLTEGRNIVRLEKNGAATYQVITAKQVSAKVNGTDIDKAVVAPGEKVSVTFDTLYAPITRAALYNIDSAPIYKQISGMDGKIAGAARGSYGYYFFASTPEKQTVANLVAETDDGSSYANPIVSLGDALTVPEDYQGSEFTLSGGTFNVAGFGANYGDHRTYQSKTWGSLSPGTMAYLGQLPDITIPVGTLDKIEVTKQPTKLEYYVGDAFDMTGMEVTASYNSNSGAITRVVTDVKADVEKFTEAGTKTVTISYTQADVTKTATVEVTVKDVKMTGLEITKQPTKTVYHAGEKFDPAGMEVTAIYDNGTRKVTTDYTCTPEVLSKDDTAVTVAVGTLTAQVPVQIKLVKSIEVTAQPKKTEYKADQFFDPAGMVVTAVYSDDSKEATTDYTYEPSGRLKESDKTITITYTGKDAVDGIQPATQEITVAAAEEEPYDSITAYVSYSDKGETEIGADGTLLYNAPVKVYDRDQDGVYTMHDAFLALHEEYYIGGADGFADTSGGWVTRFWGVDTGMVSYCLNHKWVFGTTQTIEAGDKLDLYVYADSMEWADLCTWFENDVYKTEVNKDTVFTTYGANMMNSSEKQTVVAAPAGATVTAYTKDGTEVASTTVDAKGQATLKFTEDGVYTLKLSGKSTYTCEAYGGGSTVTYKDKTVAPSYCTVKVGKTSEPEDKVTDLISQINTDNYLESIDKILESKEAYDALTDKQKAEVTNADVLKEAYEVVKGVVDVIDTIKALPEEITEADREAVEAAKAAYDKLTDKEQAAVSNADQLQKAIDALKALDDSQARIDQMIEKINALPAKDKLTEEDESLVQEVRAAYEALTDAEKEKVTNLDTLETAERQIRYLKESREVREKIDAIGEVTVDNFEEKAELIAAARTAYDLLDKDAKDLVSNLDTLKQAEETYALADEDVKAVVEAIGALKEPLEKSSEDMTDEELYTVWNEYSYLVENIRGLADGLTKDQQKIVPNMSDLTLAESYLSRAMEAKVAKDAYDKAKELLSDPALPNAGDYETENPPALTEDAVDAVAAAKAAFDNLTEKQQEELDAELPDAVSNIKAMDTLLTNSDDTKDYYEKATAQAVNKAAAENFMADLAEVFGTYKDATVTRSDITVIRRTLEQYDALTDAQKELLAEATIDDQKVTDVLATLKGWADQVDADEKAAKEVTDLIKKLPTSLNWDNLDETRATLNDIVNKYNALNDQAKTYVRYLSKVEATNKVMNELTADMDAFKAVKVTATAGNVTYKSVTLTWNTVEYAKTYEVYRKGANGQWTKLTETTGTSYSDQTVAAATSYGYKVIAVTDRWGERRTESSFTELTVKTAAAPAPTPTPTPTPNPTPNPTPTPTPAPVVNKTVTATSASYNSIRLKWKKVNGASGYYIYRANSANGTYKKVAVIKKGKTTTYTNKKLTTGKTYYYKVRAYQNKKGKKVWKAYSEVVSATPTLGQVKFTKVTSGGKKATLKWKKLNGATKYEIYQSTTKDGAYQKVATVKGNKTKYTSKKLTKGATYYYKIRAYRKVGGKKVYTNYTAVKQVKIK